MVNPLRTNTRPYSGPTQGSFTAPRLKLKQVKLSHENEDNKHAYCQVHVFKRMGNVHVFVYLCVDC